MRLSKLYIVMFILGVAFCGSQIVLADGKCGNATTLPSGRCSIYAGGGSAEITAEKSAVINWANNGPKKIGLAWDYKGNPEPAYTDSMGSSYPSASGGLVWVASGNSLEIVLSVGTGGKTSGSLAFSFTSEGIEDPDSLQGLALPMIVSRAIFVPVNRPETLSRRGGPSPDGKTK